MDSPRRPRMPQDERTRFEDRLMYPARIIDGKAGYEAIS